MILSRCVSHQDPPHANGGLGRRESQGSVSSAGSLDLVSPRLPSAHRPRRLTEPAVCLVTKPHAPPEEGSRDG